MPDDSGVPVAATLEQILGAPWPAEAQLLKAARAGEHFSAPASALRRQELLRIFDAAEKDEEFLALVADYVASVHSGDAEIPRALKERVDQLPEILQYYVNELDRLCRLLEPLAMIAAKTGEGERHAAALIERSLLRFRQQARGWRSIEPDDASIQVRAELVRFLALGDDQRHPVHANGLRFDGILILGDLSLDHCTIDRPLSICGSVIDGHLTMMHASARSISLAGSNVRSISADAASFSGPVFLTEGFVCNDVSMPESRHSSTLDLSNSTIAELRLAGAQIRGSLFAREGYVGRKVDLVRAEIGGMLNFKQASIAAENDIAIIAAGLSVGGDVQLIDGFRAIGEGMFTGCRINGDFLCIGTRWAVSNGVALRLSGANIGGATVVTRSHFDGAVLADSIKVRGRADFSDGRYSVAGPPSDGNSALFCAGSEFGADVTFARSTFDGTLAADNIKVRANVLFSEGRYSCHDIAIKCDSATIDGHVQLTRAVASGEVRFMSTSIGGNIEFEGATLERLATDDEGRKTLNLQNARISGSAFLRDGLIVKGETFLPGLAVRGNLELQGSTFENERRTAVDARGCTVTSGVQLAKATAVGTITFDRARIGGDFVVSGASLAAHEWPSLSADMSEIGGSTFLDDGFSAHGRVVFYGAKIAADFICAGATFSGCPESTDTVDSPYALILDYATIGHRLIFSQGWGDSSVHAKIDGHLSLSGLAVRALYDDPPSWPNRFYTRAPSERTPNHIFMHGLHYQELGRSIDAATRLNWLGRQNPTDEDLNSYAELSTFLTKAGHDDEATKLAIVREKRLRSRRFRSLPVMRRILAAPAHFFVERLLLGIGIGYGYRPWRMLAALVIVWVACGWLYQEAAQQGVFAPLDAQVFLDNGHRACSSGNWTTCKELAPEYPRFKPWMYSLDVLLPVIDLGLETKWAPRSDPVVLSIGPASVPVSGYVPRAVMWFEIVFGWIGGALLAAAAAGLVKTRK